MFRINIDAFDFFLLACIIRINDEVLTGFSNVFVIRVATETT